MNSSENQTKVENEAPDLDFPDQKKDQLLKKIQEKIRALFTVMQESVNKSFNSCRLLNNDSLIQPAVEKCKTAVEEIRQWFVNIQNRLTGRNENAADSIPDITPDRKMTQERLDFSEKTASNSAEAGKVIQLNSVFPENITAHSDFIQKTESFYEKVLHSRQGNGDLTLTNHAAAGNTVFYAGNQKSSRINELIAQGSFSKIQKEIPNGELINRSIDSKLTKVSELLDNLQTLQNEIKTIVNKGLNV